MVIPDGRGCRPSLCNCASWPLAAANLLASYIAGTACLIVVTPMPPRLEVAVAPLALPGGAALRLGRRRRLLGKLVRAIALGLLRVGAMPGQCRLVPWIALAGAAGVISGQVLERCG